MKALVAAVALTTLTIASALMINDSSGSASGAVALDGWGDEVTFVRTCMVAIETVRGTGPAELDRAALVVADSSHSRKSEEDAPQ